MKKLFALLTALVIAAAPVTAFALGSNETQDIQVMAKYSGGTTTPDVYSVNISWGNMKFTYSEGSSRSWDPDTHQYSTSSTKSWRADGNTVTVTNHSNVDVTVRFSYAPVEKYKAVTGQLSTTSETLDAGVENQPASADSVTSTLTLSGALPSSVTEFAHVGTITVSIT